MRDKCTKAFCALRNVYGMFLKKLFIPFIIGSFCLSTGCRIGGLSVRTPSSFLDSTQSNRYTYYSYLYSTFPLDDEINVHQLDETTGDLTFVQNLDVSGIMAFPDFLAVHDSAKCLFVAHWTGTGVTSYTIAPTTGIITLADTENTGNNMSGVTISPNGNFLYSPDYQAHGIRGYSINQSDCTITELGSSPFTVDNGALDAETSPLTEVVFSRNGEQVYSLNIGSRDISVMDYNATTGVLSVSSVYETAHGECFVIHPTKDVAYVCHVDGTEEVQTLTLDTTTGEITGLLDSDVIGTSNENPYEIALSIDGNYLYVTNQTNNTEIFVYDVQADGSLNPHATPTYTITGNGTTIRGSSVSHDGKFLAVAYTGTDSLGVWEIGGTGDLTEKTPGSPYTGPGSSKEVLFHRFAVAD